MLCRGSSTSECVSGSVPVYLNVYDLTPYNGYAYWLGLGVYHSGVQVHGVEYAFGAHEYPSTGIFEGEPKQCEGFTFRKTILIGKTDKGPAEVRAVMEDLAQDYRGDAYNLITKNCNHFCNDACIKLTGNPIPNWVNRLARIGINSVATMVSYGSWYCFRGLFAYSCFFPVGFLCNCVLPASLNTTKVRHHKVEEKTPDGEKMKLRNGSSKICSSNSSSNSSSSSPSRTTRGRSRSRRTQPPSSPLIIRSPS
ncbi:hypothetical protein BT93_A0393 [Corymbia citriodora subsp. variegata]|nr:hypothetical protein BT93_A0393 [Corymbia citriodora subsp. variegata]